MLDYVCIFTKGGALLWTWSLMSGTALRGNPVDALIRNWLLEERSGESSFTYTPPNGAAYSLKWTLHNGLGLVFVAVYQRALKLLYVDELLERMKAEFPKHYQPKCFDYPAFTDSFEKARAELEGAADANKRGGVDKSMAGSDQIGSKKGGDSDAEGATVPVSAVANGSLTPGTTDKDSSGDDGDDEAGAFDVSTIKGKLAKRASAGAKRGKKTAVEDKKKKDEPKKPKQKGSGLNRIYSETNAVCAEEEEEEAAEAGGAKGRAAKGASSLLGSFVRNITTSVVGTAALTREDIVPALQGLKKKLMERNVAEGIAEKVVESVAANLEGQRLGSFTRVSSAVRAAVEQALHRILTPRRSIDILRDIALAKARGKPYTIVFVGVNGVGKSTNLAKIAYWLLQNEVSVMIAACDTFRSGAVEQLKTHCARLGVPLYERGYEKDPAKVAYEAQRAAERSHKDVLLVDTAGRMQDNEPLMRALSNLITVNSPDLVLFVGEALVGNDAVDQLTKFNQRLSDLATDAATAHTIDGILLTKFDTIDDKVGAALSMVYTSGAPIMFVGCGQTYVDLKRLNVKSVVRSLLK
ncbi:SRP54-domain-containing protein [Coccomyxa subellipsoidea C-169]|uniref:SRP54-domain-containing protein n=1 Tax=Coccomyxa subellipsoidea (strain C-169) TaxID=574566 RepID=I0YYG9_COCSC|nr:SRP54-domain-containing protein [Coccomyxa subellipsoidea C-169]EIE23438.1 SRP54-domain-containing protein [Coccomyxa subellipsoidea C-169]|eukprot:XP_005647982.1 SRP54-domain-containing protein [Coccomyxa subellipsoidea C-169]